jgi:hypothetical protein
LRRSTIAAAAAAALLGVLVGILVARALDNDASSAAPKPPTRPAATTTRPAATTTQAAPVPRPWLDVRLLRAAVSDAADGAEVGVAVQALGDGRAVTAGVLQTGEAWSTMKVPVVLARYRLAASRNESAQEVDGLAKRALTASDNAAAEELFADIVAAEGTVAQASDYVEQVLRQAGDRATVVNDVRSRPEFSIFGQTRWSLTDGARFFRALANRCVEPFGAGEKVVGLLGRVISSQRWGAGHADFDDATTELKGGWGPGVDGRYLVRQFAIVRTASGAGFVLGTMAIAPSYDSGVAANDRLAQAAASAVRIERLTPPRGCG